MPPVTDIGSLAVALTQAAFLGAIVSMALVKVPYLRGAFAALDGVKLLGESAQLLVVIILTFVLALVGYLYAHGIAITAITIDDLFPLALAVGTAVGSSQYYNAKVNVPEAAAPNAVNPLSSDAPVVK